MYRDALTQLKADVIADQKREYRARVQRRRSDRHATGYRAETFDLPIALEHRGQRCAFAAPNIAARRSKALDDWRGMRRNRPRLRGAVATEIGRRANCERDVSIRISCGRRPKDTTAGNYCARRKLCSLNASAENKEA